MNLLFFSALSLAAVSFVSAETAPAPVTVTIKTKPAQMKYDVENIKVAPGAKVTLTLQNEDDLPHNFVLCKPKDGANDKGLEVAMDAWNMGEAGMKKDWIPVNARVLAHTKMVEPHQSETFTFTAPEAAADYPFVCTFPGHALVMNGTLHVSTPVPPIKNLHYRYYIDKTAEGIKTLSDFVKLQSVEEGQLPAGKMDIDLHKKKHSGNFAYEFEGSLDCPKTGEYKFKMGSDDGSQLWIDDKELLKIDGIHPVNFNDKKLKLTMGEHKIKVHYFQAGGGAEFYFSWSGPGFTETWLSTAEGTTSLRKSDKEDNEGIPLVVDKEARIFRNFIAGSSPRGIAVGYPGGVNLCWDADQMNVALVWQGAFIDAKRHWTGRGVGDQPPLGYGVAKLGKERALGILASQTDPWVPAYKPNLMKDMAYTFHGYELDAKRQPTFKWEFNGVSVTETFAPSGDARTNTAALRRVVKFSSKKPVENLYFMALLGAFEEKEGAFFFDNTVKVTIQGVQPLVRSMGGRHEALVPIALKDGKAEVTMNYTWALK